MVAVVDKTNGQGASYWVDDYLHLMRRQDSYFQTQNVMDLTRNSRTSLTSARVRLRNRTGFIRALLSWIRTSIFTCMGADS